MKKERKESFAIERALSANLARRNAAKRKAWAHWHDSCILRATSSLTTTQTGPTLSFWYLQEDHQRKELLAAYCEFNSSVEVGSVLKFPVLDEVCCGQVHLLLSLSFSSTLSHRTDAEARE